MSVECEGYWKFFIEANCAFCVTTAPPKLLLHVERYAYYIVSSRCAMAYDPSSTQPRNEYWAQVKPDYLPHVNGAIVLFRHWGTFDYNDLAATKALNARRFFCLGEDTDAKWQRPWLPLRMR